MLPAAAELLSRLGDVSVRLELAADETCVFPGWNTVSQRERSVLGACRSQRERESMTEILVLAGVPVLCGYY